MLRTLPTRALHLVLSLAMLAAPAVARTGVMPSGGSAAACGVPHGIATESPSTAERSATPGGEPAASAPDSAERSILDAVTSTVAERAAEAPTPRLAADREIRALEAQAAGGRGFGRWLKKHWYVPVLVGVGLAVALSDDGSDGPGDIED